MTPQKKKFDPEGKGYDYESAEKYGVKSDSSGHWSSRIPETGLLLKGSKHETWHKTLEAEKKLGCKVLKKKDGRYYSICPGDTLNGKKN